MTCLISQKVGESLPFVYVSPVSNQFETSVNRLVSAVAECDLSECSSSFGKLVKSVTVDQINAAVEDLIKCGKVLPFDVSYLSPVGYVFGVRVLYALSSVGGAIGYVTNLITDSITNSRSGKNGVSVLGGTLFLNWNECAMDVIIDHYCDKKLDMKDDYINSMEN